MVRNKSFQWMLMAAAVVLGLVGVTSCYNDADSIVDDGQEPLPVATDSTLFQVMTVFAPDQLGDNGYADNVMQGVSKLIYYADTASASSIGADFISCNDYNETRHALENWLANPMSTVTGNVFARRLLVLTEPFMTEWLDACKDQFRPTDEVLVLKTIQDDVDSFNSTLHLGNRLHGVNISMSEPVRMYYSMVRWYRSYMEKFYSTEVDIKHIPLFRLYGNELMTYRDSVVETLNEEQEEIVISQVVLNMKGTDGNPEPAFEMNTLDMRLSLILQAFNQMKRNNTYFPICDLGATNAVLDFFLLGGSYDTILQPLLLDAGPSKVERNYILRPFDRLLASWIGRWMTGGVGEMPGAEVHGHWDGYSCITNMWYVVEEIDTNDDDFGDDDDDEYDDNDDEDYGDDDAPDDGDI